MQVIQFSGHNGLRLTANVGGDPQHLPVILLHGAGQTRRSWNKAADELIALGFHLIALDLRGHGDSEWADAGGYSFDAHIGDLKSICASLSRPPVFVGASMGGMISLMTAAENSPSLASALVLVDVVPRMDKSGIDNIRTFITANSDGFSSLEEAADAVARYLPHRPKRASTDGLMKSLRSGEDGRLYWQWDPAALDMHSQEQLDEIVVRMEAAAKKLTIPTLVLRGNKSELVARAGVTSLLELIPHAETTDIADAHHMVAGDNNDAFNEAIRTFLQKL